MTYLIKGRKLLTNKTTMTKKVLFVLIPLCILIAGYFSIKNWLYPTPPKIDNGAPYNVQDNKWPVNNEVDKNAPNAKM